MSKKYPGGLITKTPITPTGPYENGSASGVWSMEQMQYWLKQGLWPIAGNTDPGDPYFKYVTLLLNGNGTNGAQNNTFVDSSSSANTMYRNGNTTQGSFSPYGSLWSNYFNGATYDGLTVGQNDAFNLGSNDFTIECFVFVNSLSTDQLFVGKQYVDENEGLSYNIKFTTASGLTASIKSSTTKYTVSASTGFSANTWNHVAFVRTGGTLALFLNGVRKQTTNVTGVTVASLPSDIFIASRSGTLVTTGYISNVRLVNGSSVYNAGSSTITVPTTPLTAVTNTQLLTCQSNRFIDNSSNNFNISFGGGNPSVQRFSPFEPSSPGYTTATIGGSGYLNNSTTDYVYTGRTLDNVTTATIGAWIYPISISGPMNIAYNGTSASLAWTLILTANGGLQFRANSGIGIKASAGDGTIQFNAWNYVVVTYSPSDIKIYVNGTVVGTGTDTANIGNNSTTYIGKQYWTSPSTYGNNFNGYMSDVFLSNTVMSATMPTAPKSSDSSMVLLLNYTNAGIPDYAMMNDLETVGNAQVSTSVSKFGTGSIYLPNPSSTATDYLTVTNNSSQNIYFGSANFTIEAWVYLTETAPDASPVLMQMTNNTGDGCFAFVVTSGRNIRAGYTTTGTWQSKAYNTTSTISLNTWAHIAWVRDGSTMYTYVNGVSGGSYSCGTDVIYYSSTIPVRIGTDAAADGNANFTGYIDDLRVTKGYCRYPSGTTFTPPTSAFYTY